MCINLYKSKAAELRLKILNLAVKKSKGHLGGTFSCLDLMVYLFYSNFLNISKKNHNNKKRNKFILSKGHACIAQYLILNDLKIISKKTLNSYGSDGGLGAQLDINTPGVDWNTGSLGHSLGVISGMAASSDNPHKKFVTIVGDAEMDEGSVWEALAFCGEKKLSNVVVIIDRNRLSVTDTLEDVGIFRDFHNIVNSLGWNSYEINGHDFIEMEKVFKKIKVSKKPVIILANTIKGKGISFMENSIKWHHAIPTNEEYKLAEKELRNGK